MKLFTFFLLFISNFCSAQQWQVEVGGGISGYSGDLSRPALNVKTFGPSFCANLKYMMPNNFIVLRGGMSYGKIQGNDKDNKDPGLVSRNLNFKSNILEGSLAVEVNLVDPTVYDGLPYVFVGVGVFHFDPYTYDHNNNKVFLQPLGTEGQGLSEYSNRPMYSRTKVCIPFGVGWKYQMNSKIEFSYELGFRYTNTDYLDDVSSTYADPQVLLAKRGPLAAELAFRQNKSSAGIAGHVRGNPDSKDWYYMSSIKVCFKL
jgi:hypothetical protein